MNDACVGSNSTPSSSMTFQRRYVRGNGMCVPHKPRPLIWRRKQEFRDLHLVVLILGAS
jgi:hypothetical protein